MGGTVRRNARGEASLQAILDATRRLLGAHGYDSTTITAITREAGRPASSIYWYFATKEDLVAAALETSYTSAGPGHRAGWDRFDPAVPLLEQLEAIMTVELRPTESEGAVRLGMMLALEGSAGLDAIQQPFRRRRALALEAVTRWWDDALQHGGAGSDSQAGALLLQQLTLALLDGHYVWDVAPQAGDTQSRARMVAHGFVTAYEAVLQEGSKAFDIPRPEAMPDESDPGDLLAVTRRLVAERGLDGATMTRICEGSGMRRSSIYWRHKDKDALVHASVTAPFLALLAPLTRLEGERPEEELADLVGPTLQAATRQRDTVKAGLLLLAHGGSAEQGASFELHREVVAMERRLAERLSTAGGPRDAAACADVAWLVARLLQGAMLGEALAGGATVSGWAGLLGVTLRAAALRAFALAEPEVQSSRSW